MLQFFPTPYPNELWYSILCRYHMRSGNVTNRASMFELFNEKKIAGLGSPFPNNSIARVRRQLPKGYIDVNDIVFNNTLFLYFTRIMSYEQKSGLLKDIHQGNVGIIKYIWITLKKFNPSLRLCPLCIKDDELKYGESYWHLDHQLPLMFICPKHGCRLIQYPVNDRSDFSRTFILPRHYKGDMLVDYNINEYEKRLSEESIKYQHLPMDIGQKMEYNNIFQGLINNDYIMKPLQGIAVNAGKVTDDLIEFYGKELVDKVFGEYPNNAVFRNIKKWDYFSPERYILLAILINQSTDVTFGPQISYIVLEKLLEEKRKDAIYSRVDLARRIGVTPIELNRIAKDYNIEPFWRQIDLNSKEKIRCTHVSMKQSELEKIKIYSQKRHFASIPKFAIYCMQKEMQAHPIENTD